MINHQNNNDNNVIDKIYLYAKDTYKAKYQFLNNKCEKECLNHLEDLEVFIEYSNNMQRCLPKY